MGNDGQEGQEGQEWQERQEGGIDAKERMKKGGRGYRHESWRPSLSHMPPKPHSLIVWTLAELNAEIRSVR
jgi:hypothetical protein